jgi:hypothetical protein
MLSEDLSLKAKDAALTFTADSVLPPGLQASKAISLLAILLAAASSSSSSSEVVIGLSLTNRFNSLPAARPASDFSSPFQPTVFDLSIDSELTDTSFSDALLAVVNGVDIQPADQAILRRPFITTASLLETAALSELLWQYSACAPGLWAQVQSAIIFQTSSYARDVTPLYLSLAVQLVDALVQESKLPKKEGPDFLARARHVLAPVLAGIANV